MVTGPHTLQIEPSPLGAVADVGYKAGNSLASFEGAPMAPPTRAAHDGLELPMIGFGTHRERKYSANTPFMPAMKHVLGLQGRGMTDVVRLPAVRVCERETALAKEFADAAATAEWECHV